jgi:AraC family transcriptional regulator, regulatory protein of adaptative response / methylated-DNA-[protein]-cysteine methyltransferase
MPIRYTIIPCGLGRLLVAATERGVCAVSLADADGALEAFLRDEYPAAEIRRDDVPLRTWATELRRHLDGEQPQLQLPLDVPGTAFQRRVWQELLRIPYGETRSYAALARALGQPTASRAVARACATNPAAVVIPCHRVVGSDGALTGYRWGLERKRALLQRERQSR